MTDITKAERDELRALVDALVVARNPIYDERDRKALERALSMLLKAGRDASERINARFDCPHCRGSGVPEDPAMVKEADALRAKLAALGARP